MIGSYRPFCDPLKKNGLITRFENHISLNVLSMAFVYKN